MAKDLFIYDVISSWWGIGAQQVRDELKAIGPDEDLVVRMNSPGGDVFEGMAIANMIRAHGAKTKTCCVDGLAASMGSVIALACDAVVMADGAMMMIHDPWGLAIGDAEDLREQAVVLDKIKQGLIAFYRRSGKTDAEISAIMSAETWYTAQEAVDAGFADRIGAPVQLSARLSARSRSYFAALPVYAERFFDGAPKEAQGDRMDPKIPTPPVDVAPSEDARRAGALAQLEQKRIPAQFVAAAKDLPIEALEKYAQTSQPFPVPMSDRTEDQPQSPRQVAPDAGKKSAELGYGARAVAQQLGVSADKLAEHRATPWHAKAKQQGPTLAELLEEEERAAAAAPPAPVTQAEERTASAMGISKEQLEKHRKAPWHGQRAQ